MPDLRPGKPRHGGECPLPGTNHLNGDFEMLREIVGPLKVCDRVLQSEVTLEAGTAIGGCRIRRGTAEEMTRGADPYLMEFESAGRAYYCPLYRFQARTQALELQLEEQPARAAAAV